MMRAMLGLAMVVVAAPATAQDPVEKRIAAYNRCMMLAAVRASYTNAANREIYGIARAACAAARDSRAIDPSRQPVYLAAIDAADATRATHFAGWVGELRDRRRATDAPYAMSSH